MSIKTQVFVVVIVGFSLALVSAQTNATQNQTVENHISEELSDILDFETIGEQDQRTEEIVEEVDVRQGSANFEGIIEAETPCHEAKPTIEEVDGTYVLDIETVQEQEDRVCPMQIVMIEYEATFQPENEEYELEVRHNNELVDEITYPEQGTSNLEYVMNWFSNLF